MNTAASGHAPEAIFEKEASMAKLYTLDGKLLTDTPEIRIGDKIYPVDNRQKTVKKIMTLSVSGESAEASMEKLDEALRLALGTKAFREIDEQDLPFPAQQKLFELIMAAVTGEEPERFPQPEPEPAL